MTNPQPSRQDRRHGRRLLYTFIAAGVILHLLIFNLIEPPTLKSLAAVGAWATLVIIYALLTRRRGESEPPPGA